MINTMPFDMDKDQALQYGLRSGPTIWIKIRPYNNGLRSGPAILIKVRPYKID